MCQFLPCPAGVNIPSTLALYNDVLVFNDPTGVMVYNAFLSPEQKASSCTECGECEEKCPQNIQIREELKKVQLTIHMDGQKVASNNSRRLVEKNAH